MSTLFIPGFELVLASQSPRRKELLHQAGFSFAVRPASIVEVPKPGELGREYVARLAAEKSASVQGSSSEGILAADTTVIVDLGGSEVLLEKPRDTADAAAMLRLLSGRQHRVCTGISFRFADRHCLHVEETCVEFANLEDSEIEAYVASGEPFDKAGSYAIQGLASRFIRRIEGCFFNVVGLPLHQVYRILQEAQVLARAGNLSPAS